MIIDLPPRAEYLTERLLAADLQPPRLDPTRTDWLPKEIFAFTGAIRQATPPQQGVCNLLLRLEAERGVFALKVARGAYRSQELWAEHTVMQQLQGGPIPVPRSLLFLRQGDLSFQLREYRPGVPLNVAMDAVEGIRAEAISEMGRTLATIHSVRPLRARTWQQWIDASLERAALNLATGVCDPEEFTEDAPPAVVLDWLRSNRPPRGGSVSLLHGDYRPKNLLWQDNRVAGVIDWAFVDVGDPYYDLSILYWYKRSEAEWQQFLAAYGIREFDHDRFTYCTALQKFLNV